MSECSPKLLDLISKEKEKVIKEVNNEERRYGGDEKKLELRLGLPGDENWSSKQNLQKTREKEHSSSSSSLLSLGPGYYSPSSNQNNNNGGKGVIGCVQEENYHSWNSQQQQKQQTQSSTCPFVQQQQQQQQQQYSKTCTQQTKGVSVMGKDSSQPCCTRIVDLQSAEKKKAFSPPSSAHTAVPNTSQKRAAPAPVVGWPPIRSFRKNLASSSSGKGVPEPQSAIPSKPVNVNVNEKPATNDTVARKGLFVKINMDGVPIGRKVDLSVYNNYDSLSTAVDELFRGLLAAQRDSSVGAMDNEQEEQKPITGLLDGSGEYTLVYEDNEGDRMLVGDVPWHMFASTVKRLRVLKSSDLATLSRGGNKEGKVMVEIPSK